jgi:hypothetical protein
MILFKLYSYNLLYSTLCCEHSGFMITDTYAQLKLIYLVLIQQKSYSFLFKEGMRAFDNK